MTFIQEIFKDFENWRHVLQKWRFRTTLHSVRKVTILIVKLRFFFLRVVSLSQSRPIVCVSEGRSSLCVGCGGRIHDQWILRVAPNLEWHAACLKCAECQQFLDEKCTCFVRDGKTYCKRDYVRWVTSTLSSKELDVGKSNRETSFERLFN